MNDLTASRSEVVLTFLTHKPIGLSLSSLNYFVTKIPFSDSELLRIRMTISPMAEMLLRLIECRPVQVIMKCDGDG